MSLYDRDYMRPGGGSRFSLSRMNAFHVVFWLNIAVFVAQYVFGWGMQTAMVGNEIVRAPLGGVSLQALTEGRIWTIFTFMFVHGSLGHILMNMIFLWFVGKQVYQIFGAGHFIRIYLLSGLLGAALEIALRAWFGGGDVYLVGASASVFGLFLALAVTLPQEVITAMIYFVLPIRVRMWKLAAVLVGINVVLGLVSLFSPGFFASNVAYFAHLGGALAGWYYIRMLGYGGHPMTYRQLWQRRDTPGMRHSRKRLRLVRSRPQVEMESSAKPRQNVNVVTDLIEEDINPILDKINDQGMGSLTDEERRLLDRASRMASEDSGESSR